MSMGDRLINKRRALLFRLYEYGAFSPNSGFDGSQLQEFIEVNNEEFEILYKSLKKSRFDSLYKNLG